MEKMVARVAVGLLLALFCGCENDGFEAHIQGQVIVDGQPVQQGSISFFPLDGTSPTTGDPDIIDGKYECAVPLGESKVEIRVPRKTGSRKLYDTPDSPIQETFEEVLPAKYNSMSKLRFTAQPGMNEKNWELNSSGK